MNPGSTGAISPHRPSRTNRWPESILLQREDGRPWMVRTMTRGRAATVEADQASLMPNVSRRVKDPIIPDDSRGNSCLLPFPRHRHASDPPLEMYNGWTSPRIQCPAFDSPDRCATREKVWQHPVQRDSTQRSPFRRRGLPHIPVAFRSPLGEKRQSSAGARFGPWPKARKRGETIVGLERPEGEGFRDYRFVASPSRSRSHLSQKWWIPR